MEDLIIKEIRIAVNEIWLTPIENIMHDNLFYVRLHQLPIEKQREYMDSIGAVIKKGEDVMIIIVKNQITTYAVTKPEYNPLPDIKANVTKEPFDWNFNEIRSKYNV